MDTFWTAVGGWWVQAALSGGAVLLLGWLGMMAFRRPALRQQIGAWAVRGAVLAAVLSGLPHWVLLPRPAWMTSPADVKVAQAPTPTPESTRQPAPPALVGESEPEAVEWVFVPRQAVARPELPATVEEKVPAALPVAVEEKTAPAPPPALTDSPVSPAVSVVPLLVCVYFVVAGVLLLQLVGERLGLAWLLRDAAPLVGRARWVLDQLTVGEPLPLAYASARVRSPLCVGFFRPLLVLPKGMADGADELTLRWVLAHELDHLRRGDTRTAWWVGVARAVFFFVPWFWLVRRDLGLCQEFLADAAAANLGGTPADYAAFLVDLSGGRTTRRPLPAARMRAGKSELFRRVHMLLNVKTAARGVTRGFTWLAGTAAVATAVSLAGLGFADEPKKEESKPAKVIEIEKAKDAPKEVPAEVTQKQLHELVEALQGKGRLDEAALAELIKKLEKDGAIDPGTLQRMMKRKDVVEVIDRNRLEIPVERLRLQPPVDVIRGGGVRVVVPPGESDLRKQYEQQLKEFEERIKKAGDAEAKEQLEKTRDEYKKAMEEPLKKADAAQKDVDAARHKLDDAERANRDQNAEAFRRLAEMQRDMQKRMAEDFRRLEGREGFGRLDVQPFVLGPDGLFTPVGRNAAQPRLGVKIEKVSAVLAEQLDLPKDSGIVIAEVTAGSAAEKAGLKKNDVLLKLAGKDVPTDPEVFTALVGKLNAGEKLDAEVLRKGKKETVKGIELPEARQPGRGGLDRIPDRGGRQGGGNANESVQVQINDDEATLQATVGDAAYTVTGTVEKGKLTPTKIVVKEGRESKEYASLEKMPEGERATVERLLGKVRLSGGR